MESLAREIQIVFQKLMRNLNWDYELEDFMDLTNEGLYFEIYLTLFPTLEPTIAEISAIEEQIPGERIGYLIEFLSTEILHLDLSHIRGEMIVKGDPKHIMNFLQLLYEISKMYLQREEEAYVQHSKKKKNADGRRVKSNSSNIKDSDEEEEGLGRFHRAHSAQGIQDEFGDERDFEEGYQEIDELEGHEHEHGHGHGHGHGHPHHHPHPDEYDEDQIEEEGEEVYKFHQLQADQKKKKEAKQQADMFGKAGKEQERSSDQKEKESHKKELQSSQKQQPQLPDDQGRDNKINSKSQSKEASRVSEVNKDKELHRFEEAQNKDKAGRDENKMAPKEELFNKQPNIGQPKKTNYISRSFEMDARRGYDVEDEEAPDQEDMYYQDEQGDVEDEGNFEMANIDREIDKQDRLYLSLKAQAQAGGHEHDAGHKHSEIEEKDEIDYYENDPINYNRIMENLYDVPGNDQEAQEGDEEIENIGQDDEYEDQEGYGEDQNDQNADKDIQQRIMAIMQQQQHHQDEDQQLEEEYNRNERDLYEEDQNNEAYENDNLAKTAAPRKKAAPKKKQKGNYQTTKIRSLNPSANKKEPIYSQTMGYKSKGLPPKATKSQKTKGQTKNQANNQIDRNQQHQNEVAHNHIINMGYGEGIEEVDEEPASENEIMPKIEESQGEEGQNSGKENQIYDVLSENVKKAKQNLRSIPKNDLQEGPPHQSSNYKAYLDNYLRGHKAQKAKTKSTTSKSQTKSQYSSRSTKRYDQLLKRELDNQQRVVSAKLRDEKINYLRKIHKIVFELEKKKMIEEKREFMKSRNNQNEQARYLIESVENMYQSKLNILKQRRMNDNNEHRLIQDAQARLLKDLHNDLREDRERQIQLLQEKLRFEKENFENLIRDDGFLEQKIMEIYKKFN